MTAYGFRDQQGNAYNTGGDTLEEAIQNAIRSYPELSRPGAGTFLIQNNETNEYISKNFNPINYSEAINSGSNYTEAFSQANSRTDPAFVDTPAMSQILSDPEPVAEETTGSGPTPGIEIVGAVEGNPSIEYTQMPNGQLSYDLFSESGQLQQSGTTTQEAADSGLFGADTSNNYDVSYSEPELLRG
tara:strand:- start:129 stop:689 length:561 start_codon:yes stop_codon:yes gene_type:complete